MPSAAAVTESEWLAATDPEPMLRFLHQGEAPSHRKLRLFAAALGRHARDLPPALAECGTRILDAAAEGLELTFDISRLLERYLSELQRTRDQGMTEAQELRCNEYIYILDSVLPPPLGTAEGVLLWSLYSGCFLPDGNRDWPRESAPTTSLAEVVRDVIGNPFRPAPAVDLAWLARQGGAVLQLARDAYEDRRLPDGTLDPARLAVLADALEDAGCGDAELLGHLRGPGVHVRGCWAVDLLLGKS